MRFYGLNYQDDVESAGFFLFFDFVQKYVQWVNMIK